MGSDFVNVNTDRLKGDISYMMNELEIINQNMKNLYENVEALNGTKQFTSDYSLVTSNLEDIRKYLDALSECCSKYNSCENNVGQLVDTLQV